jgi:lipopolysaccharide transport system permease protein
MNDIPSYAGGFTVVGGVRETPLESLREIWRFRPLIAELVRRDLKVRYKNRVGGILWSLFPPLMRVLTIHLMVKFFFAPIEGYSGYLLPVIFLWQFVQNCVLDASQSLIINAPLVRKIYFPRAILPLVSMITNLIHFGISLAFMVVYYFIVPISHPVFPQNLGWKFIFIFPFIAGMAAFSLGVGYLLAYANTLYDDIRYLTFTFLELFLYALPIYYPIERVAARPELYSIYMLNPVAVWLVGFQRSFLPPIPVEGAAPFHMPWDFLSIAAVTSVVVLVLGFSIFERSKWAMMERL